jgi:hypothetical protein
MPVALAGQQCIFHGFQGEKCVNASKSGGTLLTWLADKNTTPRHLKISVLLDMQMNIFKKCLQKREQGTGRSGAAKAHKSEAPTVTDNPQHTPPTKHSYGLVQSYLEKDPVCRQKLGPRDQPIETGDEETICYSKETVEIANALHRDGKAPQKVEVLLIGSKLPDRTPAEPTAIESVPAPAPALTPTPATAPPAHTEPHSVATESVEGDGSKEAKDLQPATAGCQMDCKDGEPMKADVMPVVIPVVLPDTLDDFTIQIKKRIKSQCEQYVGDTIAIGEAFLKASQKYGKDLKELAAKSELSYNTVTQYLKVAKRFGPIQKSWARAQLPASVDSLVRLSRLEPKQLEEAIKQGKVKPDMGRKEVKTVLLEYRPASTKNALKELSSEATIPTPPAILEELRNRAMHLTLVTFCSTRCLKSVPNELLA